MAKVDTWTDARVERAVRLLQVGEGIVNSYRHPERTHSWRPVTIDRWLTDVADFLAALCLEEEVVDEEAAAN